jgi:hypothetical protein
MYINGVQEYARETVFAQPNPPRRVSLWTLVARSYASTTGKVVAGVGLALGSPVIAIAVFFGGPWTIARITLLVLSTLVTVAASGSPGLYGWRMWGALKNGTVARAEVIRVTFSGPSLRPDTIDAQRHGMARGTWRVDGLDGRFDASFECDASWASQLQRGTEVQLIIDATRPRVLLDLGPNSN